MSQTPLACPLGLVSDLLISFNVGEEAFETFKQTILDDDPPSVKFHDKMTKQRLKTFSTISTEISPMKGQHVALTADLLLACASKHHSYVQKTVFEPRPRLYVQLNQSMHPLRRAVDGTASTSDMV